MVCRAIPYEGKDPYIFVSYCHADKALIYPLIEQMTLDGYRTWYDVGNKPGMNWLLNIEDHLENCKVVISFISGHSSDSNNCNKEIVYAMKCNKKVIPILIEDVELPKGLRMQMVDLHYLERKKYPSDKLLLKKCYEIEECKECRDPSGSISLRSDGYVRPHTSPENSEWGGIMENLIQVNRKNVHEIRSKTQEVPFLRENQGEKPVHHNAITETNVHNDTNQKSAAEECSENLHIPSFGLNGNITSCECNPDEGTVLVSQGSELDNDHTVRISRNLAILIHLAEQKAYKLKSPKITLGRSKIRCDVVIEGNDSISKVHAFIRQSKQKCYIEDANSSNGTYINGEQIEPSSQIPLDNPAIFQLNDEALILLSGLIARKYDKKTYISLLVNSERTAVRIMEADTLPLNRNNKWPDGTLSDPKVHRAGHALLTRRDDIVYLVDQSPENGNGTYLNGSIMQHGTETPLTSGDHIRLGDTTLEFFSIEIPS